MAEKKSSIIILESTFILSFLFMLFYGISTLLIYSNFTDQRYFDVWSKIMMPPTGFPITFFISVIFYSLVFSLIISLVYRFTKKSFSTKSQLFSGLLFGLALFFLTFVPMYSQIYLIFNIPLTILLTWTVSSLLFSLLGGIMLSLVNN